VTDDAAVLTRMLHAIDARDWDGVRAEFAEEVATDYTSLWGGEPATVSVDDLLAGLTLQTYQQEGDRDIPARARAHAMR
jgi:hypothetical protein